MLCMIDEYTREALAIRVKRKLNSTDVLETLADVMIDRGTPQTYVPTMALSSLLWLCGNGSLTSARRPPASSQAVPGKTRSARASIASCETSC